MGLYPCSEMKKETIFAGTSSSTLTKSLDWNASSKPTFALSKSVYNYDFIIIRYGINPTSNQQCSHDLWLDVEEIRKKINFNHELTNPYGTFTDAMIAAFNYNNTGTNYAYVPLFKFTDDTHVALNQASISGWTEQPYLYEIIGIKL